MNEISCDVCMDLIPLVQDGIASEDSREAVEKHIKNCESCAACYSGTILPVADSERLIVDVRRKVQFFFVITMTKRQNLLLEHQYIVGSRIT